MMEIIKTGILGGSFDPPHYGHFQLCELAAKAVWLDRIILMPSGDHPFKGEGGAAREHRLAMCGMMCRLDKRLTVSTIEIDRSEVSYTVDTLRKLRTLYPRDDFWFICGSDLLEDIPIWKDFASLASLTKFVCITRQGTDLKDILKLAMTANREYGAHIVLCEDIAANISSTQIRANLEENQSYLIPGVSAYIRENGLYDARWFRG